MIAGTILTDRLVLRPLAEGDLADVKRIAGDYDVSKWLVPVAHPYTMADAQEFLQLDRTGDLGTLWVITKDHQFVGAISIGKELGYWLDPGAWGQGIMTEAGQAVVEAYFESTNAAVIYSSYFEGNDGSRRVLEKLGFVDAGGCVMFSRGRNAEVLARSMELHRKAWDSGLHG